MKSRVARLVCTLGLVYLNTEIVSASPITITIPTTNTLVGLCCNVEEFFNYFTVDVPDLPEMDSATLRLLRGHINTSGDFPPYPTAGFELVISGTAADIGNGTGTVRPVATAVYTAPVSIPISPGEWWVDFPFNAQGVADLNAARGGTLSFFGELVSIPDLATGVQEWYAFDGATPLPGDPSHSISQLVVTPVPEPTTVVLLGPAILGWCGLRRRMRRRT